MKGSACRRQNEIGRPDVLLLLYTPASRHGRWSVDRFQQLYQRKKRRRSRQAQSIKAHLKQRNAWPYPRQNESRQHSRGRLPAVSDGHKMPLASIVANHMWRDPVCPMGDNNHKNFTGTDTTLNRASAGSDRQPIDWVPETPPEVGFQAAQATAGANR